jgi:HEAT repeat protein
MRMQAADAAGRMRLAKAGDVLAKLVSEEEPNTRHAYVWALIRIGSKDALPKLIESAGKGFWDARQESLRGIAMLGDDPSVLTKLAAAEQATYQAECKKDADAPDCQDIPGKVEKHVRIIKGFEARMLAGKECGDAVACWAKHLTDADEGVRERAAYVVGRSKDGAQLAPMLAHLNDKGREARAAFIQGADWLIFDVPSAKAEAKKALPTLKKQLSDERGSTEYAKVNEDLRRLVAAIER